MALDDDYLSSVGVRDLMAQLMLRRERVLRLADVVGVDEAKRGYDDVSAAIDALEVVLETLDRPRAPWIDPVTGNRRGTSPLRRP